MELINGYVEQKNGSYIKQNTEMEEPNLEVLAIKDNLTDPLLRQANKLFLAHRYEAAVDLYRRYIQDHIDEEANIDGLGNHQLSIGYYEWFISEWYRDGILSGIYQGSAYDFLSLCYQSLKTNNDAMEEGIMWYRKMIGSAPGSYQLRFGYANILSNKSIYDEALDEYSKVIGLKPTWIKPYECIAYIHEYNRIQKPKAIEMANRILEMDPENRAALFVLSRNQKNPDVKIEKLKKVFQLHPRFARALNEIGIVYGGTKKEYDDAIKWYKKCVEIAPQYASCYNNIGVNYEIKKQYPQALEWYFKAIEKDKNYKAPHKNLIDVVNNIEYSDEQIQAEMKKYAIFDDYFYYGFGLAYYDKKQYDKSIKYYMKVYDCINEMTKQIHKLHNSTAITYDQMKNYDEAIKYYKMCIEANPKFSASYYNMAIVYKRMNSTQEAISWYKKAIEINPRYSYAYNNLGNVYKNQNNYEEAIKCYKKAVEHLSTYTLALANLGACYLKLKNYREAFNAMSRAKEILPNDNNNLSESNKSFLKDTLDQFDKQGQIWRQNGFVTTQLKSHLQTYQSKFKQFYTNQDKEPVIAEKVMKKQVLQILELVHKDQFDLTSIDNINELVKKAFGDNEQYFYIIPQLFVQYFFKQVFLKHRQVLQVEAELSGLANRLYLKSLTSNNLQGDEIEQERRLPSNIFCELNPSIAASPNLFKEGMIFSEYSQLYTQLMRVNDTAKESYKQFKGVVDQVRKQSHGIPYGVEIKIPSSGKQQFQVLLGILQRIFSKEIDEDCTKTIIKVVFLHLQQNFQNKKPLLLEDIEHYTTKAWLNQINGILTKRKENKIATRCQIGDLLKGKIIFNCVDHLKTAIAVAEQISKAKGHKLISLQNHLLQSTQDVVLNIQVRETVCQLRLEMKQDTTHLHFAQAIEQLQHSPLGCFLGSCLLLCKEINYPFLRNCQDIVTHLMQQENQSNKTTLEATLYAIQMLNESNLAPK